MCSIVGVKGRVKKQTRWCVDKWAAIALFSKVLNFSATGWTIYALATGWTNKYLEFLNCIEKFRIRKKSYGLKIGEK